MANFNVEKMLSEGFNKDEIWKKFDAEIKDAQDRLAQKAKAEEEKQKMAEKAAKAAAKAARKAAEQQK